MIFVSIGSMFPFDRLIQRVDALAGERPSLEFFAQIGDGAYEPAHMPFARMLSRRDFMEKLRGAELLLAHAGMGSIISALEVGTPTLVLPRRASLGEVNTDHQLATARWLEGRPGIQVCFDEADLPAAFDEALAGAAAGDAVTRTAPPEFIARLRQFITAA